MWLLKRGEHNAERRQNERRIKRKGSIKKEDLELDKFGARGEKLGP